MTVRKATLPARLLAIGIALLLGVTALAHITWPSASANLPASSGVSKVTTHLKGASLTNSKLHVRSTIVGWGKVGISVPVRGKHGKVTHKWLVTTGAHFVSVHFNKKGHPIGAKVSFYQTSRGPADVIITNPPLHKRQPAALRYPTAPRIANRWWNPITWGAPIVSFAATHVLKPCGNGVVDGYISFESTYLAAQMLAAGGAITTTTAVGVTNPEMLAVGVVGGCFFGLLRPKH